MLKLTGTAADPVQDIKARLENLRGVFVIAEDLRHVSKMGRMMLDSGDGPVAFNGCVSLFGLVGEVAGKIESFEKELEDISSRLDSLTELQAKD